MTIKSAILALAPYVYWPLDETSGTNVHDEGSAGKAGTISGDYAWGMTGAEIGTTGVRLFAGATIIGPGMGLNTFNAPYSFMCFATVPAAGGIAAATTFAAIGDFANPTIRGVRWGQSSSAQDNVNYRQTSTGNQVNIPLGRNFGNWHHLCWTYNNSPLLSAPFLDGAALTTSNLNLGTAWQAIDPLYFIGNVPIVIQHVAWFNRVLSQLEIQSVANQIQPWPYYIPGNQMPSGTGGEGGGGLTEDQAAQLSNIETNTDATLPIVTAMQSVLNTVKTGVDQILGYWNGYETVTLPSLSEVLGNIQSSVTSTVGGGADTVQKTLGELFSRNPVDSLLAADLSEGETCERIDLDVGLGGLYGIVLYITTVPPDWEFRTPDNAWGLKDLAVIRITRGGHLILRHGVHTTSHTISPLPELQLPWVVTALGVPTTPADYRISVDFAAGVCGRLEGLFLP